jgi:hypothetical protein
VAVRWRIECAIYFRLAAAAEWNPAGRQVTVECDGDVEARAAAGSRMCSLMTDFPCFPRWSAGRSWDRPAPPFVTDAENSPRDVTTRRAALSQLVTGRREEKKMGMPDGEFLRGLEAEVEAELHSAESSHPEDTALAAVTEWRFDPAEAENYQVELRGLLGAIEAVEEVEEVERGDR